MPLSNQKSTHNKIWRKFKLTKFYSEGVALINWIIINVVFKIWECLIEDTAKSVIYVRLPAALVLGRYWYWLLIIIILSISLS